jgi:hypothetical protein
VIHEASKNAPSGWKNNQPEEIMLKNEKMSPKSILNQKIETLTQILCFVQGRQDCCQQKHRHFPPLFLVICFFFFVFFILLKPEKE